MTLAWDTPSHGRDVVPPGAPGAVATAGYFYCAAYTPGELKLTAHPVSRTAEVIDCVGVAETLCRADGCAWSYALSVASFGGAVGYNPCTGWVARESDCGAIGPDSVAAHTSAVVYSSRYAGVLSCRQSSWSVEGSATIIDVDGGQTVALWIGAEGKFTLRQRCDIEVDAVATCCKRVTVVAETPVEATTWSRIKAAYRSE